MSKHPKISWLPQHYYMCLSKVKFSSIETAERAAKKRKKKLRAYLCPYCHLFHLTKQV